jgi:hypothetical protein
VRALALLAALVVAACGAAPSADGSPSPASDAGGSTGTCSSLIGSIPFCGVGAFVHCTACPASEDLPAGVSPACVMKPGDESGDSGVAAFWCVEDDGGAP